MGVCVGCEWGVWECVCGGVSVGVWECVGGVSGGTGTRMCIYVC